MNELYNLDASHNSEIRSSWYQLCINAGELGREGGREGCQAGARDCRGARHEQCALWGLTLCTLAAALAACLCGCLQVTMQCCRRFRRS